jgi:TolB protein
MLRTQRNQVSEKMKTAILMMLVSSAAVAADLGPFEGEQDIGKVSHPGAATFDAAANALVISGGGENMWFTNDAFHFVWRRVSGDFKLSAAVEWLNGGGNAHRKACLLVRRDLRPDSPYVDVALHGNGLTSLQYRQVRGGMTREIQYVEAGPAMAGLERQSNVFIALTPLPGPSASPASLEPAGAFIRLEFYGPAYVGLGVCAHDDKTVEQARFSNVKLETKSPPLGAATKPVLHSSLETIAIGSKDRRLVYHTRDHIEAPNWSRDGGSIVFNAKGHLFRLPVSGGTPQPIDTGFAVRCNNDHGFSPDGTQLAVSDQTKSGKSLIYLLPARGGVPKPITTFAPSYWHGWSPDGNTLVYCGERNNEFDVYSISVSGGDETRLTSAKGLDDGPDFTPDGKYIYFNSERSGSMQIWRMKPDGSDQEQVTSDEFNNWFAHPSPDGKWIVFLSYDKSVSGHPENQPVKLRLMPISGGPIQELASLFGGQGTINVPSWSPDSKNVAFVSYELICILPMDSAGRSR